MPDYKLNHRSSLLYESYYPRARIRFILSQTATQLEARVRQIAPRCRSHEPFHTADFSGPDEAEASGSRHSRQNNSGHDTTDATEAQPQRQVMQRDAQRCSDACADRDRQAKFVLPISHGLCVHASTISSPAIEQSALQAIHHSKANCKIKAVFSLSHATVLVAIHQISSETTIIRVRLGSLSKTPFGRMQVS
jgi:hypothetical protein